MEEVRVDPLQPPRVTLLQELCVPSVEELSLSPRDGVVEHVADDAAREREAVAPRASLLLEQAVAHEPLDRVVQAVDAFRECLEVAELEALSEDRRDREDVARLLRQPLDPSRHRLLDRLRQHVGRESLGAGEVQRSRVVFRDRARVEERPHELLREERVPLGGLVEARREGVRDLASARRPLDERAMLGGRERAERDRGEARVTAERLQHLDERMALVELRLPVRTHDERRRGGEPPGDVLERLDGELGAVQLLEDEDERLPVADTRERARDQLEDRGLVLGLRRARRARVRRGGPELADLAEDREEREEVAGEIGEVGPRRAARARVLGPEVVLDQLAEALMRERAVLLHEAAFEDADLPRAREARQLLDEPALPDPRLARHDGELALPGDGRVKPSLQLGDLLLAPDERGGRRLRPGTIRLAVSITERVYSSSCSLAR